MWYLTSLSALDQICATEFFCHNFFFFHCSLTRSIASNITYVEASSPFFSLLPKQALLWLSGGGKVFVWMSLATRLWCQPTKAVTVNISNASLFRWGHYEIKDWILTLALPCNSFAQKTWLKFCLYLPGKIHVNPQLFCFNLEEQVSQKYMYIHEKISMKEHLMIISFSFLRQGPNSVLIDSRWVSRNRLQLFLE